MIFIQLLAALAVLVFAIIVAEVVIRSVQSEAFTAKVIKVEGIGSTIIIGGYVGWLSGGWWLLIPCAFFGGLCGYYLCRWHDDLVEKGCYGGRSRAGYLFDDQGAELYVPDLHREQYCETDSALSGLHEGMEREAGAPTRERAEVGD
jgi:hypothetical protein